MFSNRTADGSEAGVAVADSDLEIVRISFEAEVPTTYPMVLVILDIGFLTCTPFIGLELPYPPDIGGGGAAGGGEYPAILKSPYLK